MKPVLSPQAALIYVMVIVSASDAEMSDRELHTIGEAVKTLPAFEGFEPEGLIRVAQECATVLGEPNGLEAALSMVKEGIPPHLRETAYLLGLDLALSHRPVENVELRILDRLRSMLALDKLVAAALEHSARARFMKA
jgi:hypothetical protein